ncbi:HNH endonuclease [Paracoccus nototheniae]|uniref:HNH endonuclease n=1 Tax=Paracoccus nototheniae TaxID=2489002 RepID=A0ABW4DY35_9RHOB|nr:HNH endonuclease [Paracoccus nototheniae]
MPPSPGKHRLPHQARVFSPKHKPKIPEARGTARERGYSARWDRFSLTHLQKHPLCEYCLADGRVTAAVLVDHDLPHRGDPVLFWDNTFTSLCKMHHDVDKQRAEARLSGPDLLAWVARRKAAA